MAETLTYEFGSRLILDFLFLQENGHLNLEPGFQRKSVWRDSDRKKLIESILEGYPFPTIFLYKREDQGRIVYDVVDGKQRLETIFRFVGASGFRGDRFAVRHQFPDDEHRCEYDWKTLGKYDLQAAFKGYRIQTVEISGDLSDIVDLFVRINSTGKSLVAAEKRHARYYTNPFLQEAHRQAKRFRRFLLERGVMTEGQISRMKDVELMSDLLTSVVSGGLVDRRIAVDRAIGNQGIDARTLKRAKTELGQVFNAIKRLFPSLKSTRFHNLSDFYSLAMLVWELHTEKKVLRGKDRVIAADAMLVRFAAGVDQVREDHREGRGGDTSTPYASYFLSIQQGTDRLGQRKQRAQVLRQVFAGMFEKKDDRRLFSAEQRRIVWSTAEKKVCALCGEELDWTNFQVDHLKPHSGGGKTRLGNAQIVCRPCNASKGARRAPRPAGRSTKAARLRARRSTRKA